MKDGEDSGFLTRWARRKAEARADPAIVQPGEGSDVAAETPPETEFDVSSLPAIDSLTIDSDFAQFLQKGVPQSLKSAALQKMWMSDPIIRDYIGPSEMNWDFNALEAFPGYGALSPSTNITEMVRDIADGPARKLAEALDLETSETVAEAPAEAPGAAGAVGLAERAEDPMPLGMDDVAVEAPSDGLKAAKRRHGAAIPQ